MPKPVMEEVERQLKKLERMHPDAAETATLRNWLDWMVTLPWGKSTKDNLDLKEAQRILDEDHYGLEKVKERIVEYLAVRKLKEKTKGPLLCFVGPPGVGKTSLGKSIARALGRKFVRLSLGGVKDEAEIRGHRRTYVGSMPGRIVQGIHQAGANNPVFMMDEVDKIGADFRGDPSSALLEVLDPEQNNSFRDHYLGVPFDLSNTMFICTANLTDTIQPAFLDRMEVIRLAGYTEDEKLEIAKRHLVPKQLDEHGLTPEHLVFTDKSLKALINNYTREAGLRNFEREIAAISRKVARKVAEGETGTVRVTPGSLQRFLGAPKTLPEERLKKDAVGIATGLAWTATGGDVLFVEASIMKGKGRLTLTGHLGDVMKESAQAALSWARSHARAARDQGRGLRHPRPARARAGGRHPQGRSLGGHHDGDRHPLRAHRPGRAGRGGHDRRDHPARAGAAHRRAQGEDPRRAARGHRDDRLPEAEPEGARRGPGPPAPEHRVPPRGRRRGGPAAGPRAAAGAEGPRGREEPRRGPSPGGRDGR